MLETLPWPGAALAYRRVLGLVDATQQLALMGGCQQLTSSQDTNLYKVLSAAPRAPHANETFAVCLALQGPTQSKTASQTWKFSHDTFIFCHFSGS